MDAMKTAVNKVEKNKRFIDFSLNNFAGKPKNCEKNLYC